MIVAQFSTEVAFSGNKLPSTDVMVVFTVFFEDSVDTKVCEIVDGNGNLW